MNENGRSGYLVESRIPAQVTHAPVRFSPSQPPPHDSGEPSPVVQFLLGRWRYLLVCLLLSAAMASAVAWRFGTITYQYATTLLYHQSNAGSPEYTPPDVKTLAELVRSREVLWQLREEFHLGMPIGALSACFESQSPYYARSIEISVNWEDPVEAEAMLNRLVELFEEKVQETVSESLDRLVVDFQGRIVRQREELTAANAALAAFNRKQELVDLEMDLTRALERKSDLEASLETARLDVEKAEVQRETIARMQSQKTGDDPNLTRAASLSADLQRRKILKERLDEEREQLRLAGELKLKKKEFERAKALHAKRYISDAEFERVEAELNALLLQQDGEIGRIKEALEELEARMPDVWDEASLQAMTPDRLADTAANLQLQIAASTNEVDHTVTKLALLQGEITRLQSLREQADELAQNVELEKAQMAHLEGRLSLFKQMRDSTISPFSDVQPASPSLNPYRSNARKLLVLSFAACLAVMVLPAVGNEFVRRREPPAESAARRLGLPVLAKTNAKVLCPKAAVDPHAEDDDCSRMLALRIQQSLVKPRSVLLFSGFDRYPTPMPLVCRAARCFAHRGERVVIVDTGPSASTSAALLKLAEGAVLGGENEPEDDYPLEPVDAPTESTNGNTTQVKGGTKTAKNLPARGRQGVSDFLTRQDCDVDHLIRPTALVGVDCVLSGTASMPAEGLGTLRMTELLDDLKERYTLVLLVGATTAQPVDLEMLAARADGIVFSAVGARKRNAELESVIRDLIEMDAPVVGMVT